MSKLTPSPDNNGVRRRSLRIQNIKESNRNMISKKRKFDSIDSPKMTTNKKINHKKRKISNETNNNNDGKKELNKIPTKSITILDLSENIDDSNDSDVEFIPNNNGNNSETNNETNDDMDNELNNEMVNELKSNDEQENMDICTKNIENVIENSQLKSKSKSLSIQTNQKSTKLVKKNVVLRRSPRKHNKYKNITQTNNNNNNNNTVNGNIEVNINFENGCEKELFGVFGNDLFKYESKGACINGYCKQYNQDWISMEMYDQYKYTEKTVILGVYDGHGMIGQNASLWASKIIPHEFMIHLSNINNPSNINKNSNYNYSTSNSNNSTNSNSMESTVPVSSNESNNNHNNSENKSDKTLPIMDNDSNDDNDIENTTLTQGMDDESTLNDELTNNIDDSDTKSNPLCKALNKSIKICHNDIVTMINNETVMFSQVLKRHGVGKKNIDYGTTACVLVSNGNEVIIANVGDSRCILLEGKPTKNSLKWECKPITNDHNPMQRNDERLRVQQDGGAFEQNKELRLYPGNMKFADAKKRGLAINMTRAVGHPILSKHGLIATPELSRVELVKDHHYIFIMGSDGLFDAIPNADIFKIVRDIHGKFIKSNDKNKKFQDIVVDSLLKEAEKRWIAINSGDNISIICASIIPNIMTD